MCGVHWRQLLCELDIISSDLPVLSAYRMYKSIRDISVAWCEDADMDHRGWIEEVQSWCYLILSCVWLTAHPTILSSQNFYYIFSSTTTCYMSTNIH